MILTINQKGGVRSYLISLFVKSDEIEFISKNDRPEIFTKLDRLSNAINYSGGGNFKQIIYKSSINYEDTFTAIINSLNRKESVRIRIAPWGNGYDLNSRFGLVIDETDFYRNTRPPESSNSGHIMIVTGYLKYKDSVYLKIQNSWGRLWGIRGYFYLKASKKTFDALNLSAGVIESVQR